MTKYMNLNCGISRANLYMNVSDDSFFFCSFLLFYLNSTCTDPKFPFKAMLHSRGLLLAKKHENNGIYLLVQRLVDTIQFSDSIFFLALFQLIEMLIRVSNVFEFEYKSDRVNQPFILKQG